MKSKRERALCVRDETVANPIRKVSKEPLAAIAMAATPNALTLLYWPASLRIDDKGLHPAVTRSR